VHLRERNFHPQGAAPGQEEAGPELPLQAEEVERILGELSPRVSVHGVPAVPGIREETLQYLLGVGEVGVHAAI
jgi:hypothetical protein